MRMMVHTRRSSMPFCVLVSFLVLLAAPTSSFHAAASSSRGQARQAPNLRWKQRGVRALLQTPVTVNSSNGTGPPTSYSTSVAPSGAVIININNNNNNNNNNAPNANNNNENNNGNGNGNASPSASPSPSSNPSSSPGGDGSVVPLATSGNSPPPNNNNNNNNNNNGNTGALPSGAPPVQQGTTVTQGSSSQCDIHGPNCCSDQGQNSRLLPVNGDASLASIVTSIYNAVPPGATYSPPSSVSLGYGVSAGANGRVAVKGASRGLDAFEAAVLALNLPASSAGVNYQFSQGSFICVPNLYSSSGATVLVQPTVYSNGFNNAGVNPGANPGVNPGYGQQGVNQGYGQQGGYGGNNYGRDRYGQG